MAKYEAILNGDLGVIVSDVESTIKKSISASCEESSSFSAGDVKCVIKAYERYSYIGKNRVSLTITYVKNGEDIYVTAITTGGSQAMLFKINTIGEDLFLDTIKNTLDKYKTKKLH